MAPTTTIDHDYSPDSKSDGGEGAGSKEVATVVVEGVEVDIDVQEEEAVLRRIDRFILPVMCVTFWLQVCTSSIPRNRSCKGLELDDVSAELTTSLLFLFYPCFVSLSLSHTRPSLSLVLLSFSPTPLSPFLSPPLSSSLLLFQYIDKSALAYASVFGLSKDLGLKGSQYSTLGSLFVSMQRTGSMVATGGEGDFVEAERRDARSEG